MKMRHEYLGGLSYCTVWFRTFDCACLMRSRTSPAIPVAKICIGGEEVEVEAEVCSMEFEERLCRCPNRGTCNADELVVR